MADDTRIRNEIITPYGGDNLRPFHRPAATVEERLRRARLRVTLIAQFLFLEANAKSEIADCVPGDRVDGHEAAGEILEEALQEIENVRRALPIEALNLDAPGDEKEGKEES
jgi:hypothetical protein